MKRIQLANYKAAHFGYSVSGKVATITLNRPERKNPLTLESYGELRDLFREMVYATDVKAIVFSGEGGNFCSGGDVHDIIGKLVQMKMPELLAFTRMTGDLVKAMRACPQPENSVERAPRLPPRLLEQRAGAVDDELQQLVRIELGRQLYGRLTIAGLAGTAFADDPIGKGLVMYMQMGGNAGDGATLARQTGASGFARARSSMILDARNWSRR